MSTAQCVRQSFLLAARLFHAAFFHVALLLAALTGLLTVSLQAQTYKVLYSFTGGADGAWPFAGLTPDGHGNFYGTAAAGGNLKCAYVGVPGCGVVFNVTKSGTETVLYAFQAGNDGANPMGSVIHDAQGNLYGGTEYGGDPSCPYSEGKGCGIIYKVDSKGQETVLYRFTGGQDGANPVGSLLLDKSGNLWGVTQNQGYLGNSRCYGHGCGTLFKLDAQGNLTVHPFLGPPNDGRLALAGLISDNAGNIYGTTEFGGTYDSGIVFKVNQQGEYSILHNFDIYDNDAVNPTNLIFQEGTLYGPAVSGGTYDGGALFQMDLSGQTTLLYNFYPLNDDANVWASGTVVRDGAGNIYGTTQFNGGFGSIYSVDTSGNLTTLHYFEGNPDGENPWSGVIADSNGHLYGTTWTGGNPGPGTVFELIP
jgi:uncharacterized repeat protein (TIGR03803 family)